MSKSQIAATEYIKHKKAAGEKPEAKKVKKAADEVPGAKKAADEKAKAAKRKSQSETRYDSMGNVIN